MSLGKKGALTGEKKTIMRPANRKMSRKCNYPGITGGPGSRDKESL